MKINLTRKPFELDTVATGHMIKTLMDKKNVAIKDVSKAMNVSSRRYIGGRKERPCLPSVTCTFWGSYLKQMWTICLSQSRQNEYFFS